MHNYNPDHKFKFQTRIGNWSEEWELEETRKKDYMKNKQNAQLSSIVRDQKTNFSLRKASLSGTRDGYIHFGFHVQLTNQKTQGVLSIDIQEKIKADEEAYAVTTSTLFPDPTVRSVFVIEPYDKEPNFYKDNILHYGQSFRLIANPRISNNKVFYLHSLPVTPVRCAKLSRKQEVSAMASDVFNTVWKIEHADPKYRFEMEGQPVSANDQVLIKHSFTHHWLASDDIDYQNDFGREKEVFVFSYQCLNKTQNLIAEKEGRTTIDIPLRNQETTNLWSFRLARNANEEFDESDVDDSGSIHNLIGVIRQSILQKGPYGVRSLARGLEKLDEAGTGILSQEDFKWGLRNEGVKLVDNEIKILYSHFGGNIQEFLNAFRIPLNSRRRDLITKAYQKIQSQGAVTLELLGKLIQVKQHPDVLKGYKTEQQVFTEFVSNWNTSKSISIEQFTRYYHDISSGYEKDEQFEAILIKSWGLA